jgi:hypothetical protein
MKYRSGMMHIMVSIDRTYFSGYFFDDKGLSSYRLHKQLLFKAIQDRKVMGMLASLVYKNIDNIAKRSVFNNIVYPINCFQ